jgi:hypothetical protein
VRLTRILMAVVAALAIGAALLIVLPDRTTRTRAARSGKPPLSLVSRSLAVPGPHGIDAATVHARGTFARVDGSAVTVSQALTGDHVNRCVVTVASDSAGAACDPDPFATAPVQFVESFSAGPGGKPFHEWQLSGIALPSVVRLELKDSAGRIRPVALRGGGAFFFELPRRDLAHGVTAVSLIAYGADGLLIKEVEL